MSRKGNPMIKVDNYTFCKKGVSGIKSRWVCSTHNHRGCTAMVHMIQNEIFIRSRRGKTLLAIGGYTFCLQATSGIKRRWICSTHNHKRCRAVVHTMGDEVIWLKNEHTHDVSQR
ncbi:hypothetical protein ABMA28_001439 [Loxostege sticticalis]|uniref:FLYWCH-type domain-containing protein n=1 Tax=Loxostege sticticalis TaxID=481309 RepID=A0ABD0T1W6_LOXSC